MMRKHLPITLATFAALFAIQWTTWWSPLVVLAVFVGTALSLATIDTIQERRFQRRLDEAKSLHPAGPWMPFPGFGRPRHHRVATWRRTIHQMAEDLGLASHEREEAS